ncbi:MAG: DUF1059 domain-containing protein [Thaumarchaeota archaeon]|nr:MAG: DUF1059 domain-containing protein [Nitrososphaerota archaeon]
MAPKFKCREFGFDCSCSTKGKTEGEILAILLMVMYLML